ncbi:hypothetical protein Srufu_030820 [Streptomyces libani subsp. rufus]|nr:hypothetical protein Srufu_030820 [Streptomyces libani subsp. rufus]
MGSRRAHRSGVETRRAIRRGAERKGRACMADLPNGTRKAASTPVCPRGKPWVAMTGMRLTALMRARRLGGPAVAPRAPGPRPAPPGSGGTTRGTRRVANVSHV